MVDLSALPPLVRHKALMLGARGVAWLENLPALIGDLERAWRIEVGAILQGGSEAFVAYATCADGSEAALKIFIPDVSTCASEMRLLERAGGNGYAALRRADAARSAMLMERLGAPLASTPLPVRIQIEHLCTALNKAWMPSPDGDGFMNGAEKAASLAALIIELQTRLGAPFPAAAIDMALAFAQRRAAAHRPSAAVIAHGDCHPGNALAAPGGGYKFVDPDGLFIEPAYDLGILMRDWDEDLLKGSPRSRGVQRCLTLAELTGAAPAAIWEWGFIERTSTGLYLLELGERAEAETHAAILEAWADGPSPFSA